MESIKDKVAIIGMGCIKFGENWEQSIDDMMINAVYEAYEDAGVGPEDIQAGWWGTCWSAETAQVAAGPLKLAYIPFTHVENACATGSEALRGATYAVAAGVVDDLGQFVLGQAVLPGDAEVRIHLLGGPLSDQDAERHQAAIAAAQPLAGPQLAEHTLDTDLHQLRSEAAEFDVVVGVGQRSGQHLPEDS